MQTVRDQRSTKVHYHDISFTGGCATALFKSQPHSTAFSRLFSPQKYTQRTSPPVRSRGSSADFPSFINRLNNSFWEGSFGTVLTVFFQLGGTARSDNDSVLFGCFNVKFVSQPDEKTTCPTRSGADTISTQSPLTEDYAGARK